ncbi:MAG: heparinase II/III-family protein [Verrucomicrobiae bacterium]|nr:heparinase II/III-family protein [Verrucomicrobiae bacterium]
MQFPLPTALLGAALLVTVSARALEYSTSFPAEEAHQWRFRPEGGATLMFPPAGEPAGLRWKSDAIVVATRELEVGAGPCEIAVDLRITAGRRETWRHGGIAIALGTAPPDLAGGEDWSIVFAAKEQGVIATAMRDRPMWGREVYPGAWNVVSHELAERFQTTMGGAGGHHFSVQWPNTWLEGTWLRFHAWRDSRHTLRFTLYHGDGMAAPWWEASLTLPAEFREKPLRWLSVFTVNNEPLYQPGAKPLTHAQLAGVVEGVRVRTLDEEKPRLAQPLPVPEMAFAKERGPSAWFPKGGLEELRDKFHSPAFADYKAVLLRHAGQVKPQGEAAPAHASSLAELLWAYLLTGEETFLDRLWPQLDAASGYSESLPSLKWDAPGHLRQRLQVNEFELHRYVDLAMIYDTLYDRLNPLRRSQIQRALRRLLAHYERQIKANDWWYRNNPSNTIGVGNAGSALVALALRHDDPELARRVIALAVKTFHEHFRSVASDGGCLEGNMYWNYGLHLPLLLGYALRNVDGDDRGLLRSPHFANAHRYVENNLGGDGQMICFNDTQPWLNGWVVVSAAGSEFNRPLLRWLADYEARAFAKGPTFAEQDRGLYAIGAFLLRDRQPAPQRFPGLPTLSVLESICEGVMRSEGDRFIPRLVTGVKGNGRLNTHHAQQDQGSFVLYAHGEAFLIDPGYFEGEATKHSLPLIGTNRSLNPTAHAPILDAWESGDLRSMTVDATAAYGGRSGQGTPSSAKSVRRIFVQVGALALVVLDEVVPGETGADIHAQYQIGQPVKVEGAQAVLTGAQGTVTLTTDGPPMTLRVTPRQFSREWVFTQTKVPWQTLEGTYPADPATPLLTVLAPAARGDQPVRARVTRAGETITVGLAGAEVKFIRQAKGWSAVRP